MGTLGIQAFVVDLPPYMAGLDELASHAGSSVERLRSVLQLESKPRSLEQRPSQLASQAARALAHLFEETRPRYVIYAGTGLIEKLFWSPAAFVANELGLRETFCFDIFNGCNAIACALRLAAGLIEECADDEGILVVGGENFSAWVNPRDPAHFNILNFADAGSALLLRRARERDLRFRTAAFHTDPRPVDLYAVPLLHDPVHGHRLEPGYIQVQEASQRGDYNLHGLYLENLQRVIHIALQRAQLQLNDLRFVLFNQGDHRVISEMLDILGLGEEQSFRSHRTHGHLGPADTFFALQCLLDQGQLKRGDRIILATSAIGFSWGATVLEI